MNFIYLPFADTAYEDWDPRPGAGFIMMHFGPGDSPKDPVEKQSYELTKSALKQASSYADRDAHRIMDGIFKAIHGSGFVVAVISKETPPRTIGSIFFELGIASVLGKPSMVVWSGTNQKDVVPGDLDGVFVNEYNPTKEEKFRSEVEKFERANHRRHQNYLNQAKILNERDEKDLLLLFEYFKKAFLIKADEESRQGINDVRSILYECEQRDRDLQKLLEQVSKLLSDVDSVLTLFQGEEIERTRKRVIKVADALDDRRFKSDYKNPDLILRRRLREHIRQFVLALEYREQGSA